MVAREDPAHGQQPSELMNPDFYNQQPFNDAHEDPDARAKNADEQREKPRSSNPPNHHADLEDQHHLSPSMAAEKARVRHSSLQGLSRSERPPPPDGKHELTEEECYDKLAYSWPRWKKWSFLAVVAGIQISMNFNTSVYPNAVAPLAEHFGISEQAARVGQCVYLVLYSFGCELWAPWSEELGRWPILQASLFLINIWQLPCAFAPNYGTIVVCRALVSTYFSCVMICH